MIKKVTFSFVGLLLLLILSGLTLVRAHSGGLVKEIDGYKVELAFGTEQAQTGRNEIVVRLYDAQKNAPINGARVQVMVTKKQDGNGSHQAESDISSHADSAESHTHDTDANDQSHANMTGPAESDDHGAQPHSHPAATGHTDDHHGSTPAQSADLPSDDRATEAGGHAHGGPVEPMAVDLTIGHEAGVYTGQVNFTDKGPWQANIYFTVQGQPKEVNFAIDVARSNTTWLTLGGFFGFNALVITTAAVMKRKQTS